MEFLTKEQLDPATRILPLDWGPGLEDYRQDYGHTTYDGKVVLDLGADHGSTADHFLRHGARRVIAVEGDPSLFHALQANARDIGGIIPVYLWITDPSQLVPLLRDGRPDVVKCDIEFAEIHLFNVPDAIFARVPEYLIEVHSDALLHMLEAKCARCGFEIVSIEARQRPELYIVYCRQLGA